MIQTQIDETTTSAGPRLSAPPRNSLQNALSESKSVTSLTNNSSLNILTA
jgi:hypothetical protein